MIKKYFRRNFSLLFFISIKALGMIFANYHAVKRFYFRIFDIGAFFSMVLAGIFQAPSILLPHNACILVAKIDLLQASENSATRFSGEWNPIYNSL